EFAHRFLYLEKYEPYFPRRFVAILLDAKELAQQITLMSCHVFSQIQPREFFQKAWKQESSKWIHAPNICKFIEQYNTEVRWVQYTLLTEHKATRRCRFLLRFIDIALHCQKIRNFNTLAAIHSALTMNVIANLPWNQLNRCETKKYEDFRNLFDNWKKTEFFDQQEKAPSPAIPYLALFCKQFFRIEELEEYILPDQSINYNKLLHLADRAERFRSYSRQKYSFHKKFDYQALLFKEWALLEKITDDNLYKMSKELRKKIKYFIFIFSRCFFCVFMLYKVSQVLYFRKVKWIFTHMQMFGCFFVSLFFSLSVLFFLCCRF
ncbi:Ras guanine nucleotide exchange factor, partial [Reticulomyxa filosa]